MAAIIEERGASPWWMSEYIQRVRDFILTNCSLLTELLVTCYGVCPSTLACWTLVTVSRLDSGLPDTHQISVSLDDFPQRFETVLNLNPALNGVPKKSRNEFWWGLLGEVVRKLFNLQRPPDSPKAKSRWVKDYLKIFCLWNIILYDLFQNFWPSKWFSAYSNSHIGR